MDNIARSVVSQSGTSQSLKACFIYYYSFLCGCHTRYALPCVRELCVLRVIAQSCPGYRSVFLRAEVRPPRPRLSQQINISGPVCLVRALSICHVPHVSRFVYPKREKAHCVPLFSRAGLVPGVHGCNPWWRRWPTPSRASRLSRLLLFVLGEICTASRQLLPILLGSRCRSASMDDVATLSQSPYSRVHRLWARA